MVLEFQPKFLSFILVSNFSFSFKSRCTANTNYLLCKTIFLFSYTIKKILLYFIGNNLLIYAGDGWPHPIDHFCIIVLMRMLEREAQVQSLLEAELKFTG